MWSVGNPIHFCAIMYNSQNYTHTWVTNCELGQFSLKNKYLVPYDESGELKLWEGMECSGMVIRKCKWQQCDYIYMTISLPDV